MKTFEETLKDVERDYLASLLASIKLGKLTAAEAKEAASQFLSETYETFDELFKKLYFLSNSYKEARRVFVKYAPAYYEAKDAQALSELRQFKLSLLINEGGGQHGR